MGCVLVVIWTMCSDLTCCFLLTLFPSLTSPDFVSVFPLVVVRFRLLLSSFVCFFVLFLFLLVI